MRISDWSSDVCSSDLLAEFLGRAEAAGRNGGGDLLELGLQFGALLLALGADGALEPVGQETAGQQVVDGHAGLRHLARHAGDEAMQARARTVGHDRKSTRLNSSH